MNMENTGTYAWTSHTSGRLSRKEAWAMLTNSMGPNLRALARTWLKKGAGADICPERIRLPDTPAVAMAIESLMQAGSPSLANHSFRTYFWAAGIAQIERIAFDEELLLVSSLLHDLGLTTAHACSTCSCFTLASAQAAMARMTQAGWSDSRRLAMADIICMHMNGHTQLSQGAEIYLMQQGTACDIIGARFYDFSGHFRQRLLQKYPRQDINRVFSKHMRLESEKRGLSRASLLYGAGMGVLIRLNPFDD